MAKAHGIWAMAMGHCHNSNNDNYNNNNNNNNNDDDDDDDDDDNNNNNNNNHNHNIDTLPPSFLWLAVTTAACLCGWTAGGHFCNRLPRSAR